MRASGRSLRRLLIVRLLTWQLVVLVVVALGSVLIFYSAEDSPSARFDTNVATTLAGAVVASSNGIAITETVALETLRGNSPGLWFAIVNETGRRVIGGNVPDFAASLVDALPNLKSIEITSQTSTDDGALLSEQISAAGKLKVLFGGSRPPEPIVGMLRFAAREVSPVFALIVTAIAGLTVYAIPRLVTASMSGLESVEAAASRIDIDQRGVRLPTDMVPTEVAGLVDAINSALARLDDGYAQKQRFLSDAAHELRTPIAILQNRLELAGPGGFDGRALLDVRRIANLAEQLLDLQRTAFENVVLQLVDMAALARQVMADLAPLAVAAGYDPVFDGTDGELLISGDSNALERVLINLVQNAIAHGGGAGTIQLTVTAGGVAVSDDGSGIPEDRREWIFEPFNRIKPRKEGSGLGLNLAREIIRRHRGSISVETSETGGARFLMRFDQRLVEQDGTLFKG